MSSKAILPSEAIVSLTNRCDARCTMCNIWKLEPKEALSAKDYSKGLPSSLRNINITGGEALLRPDIVDIISEIYYACNKPRIIVTTNGFRTDRTIKTVELILKHAPNLGLAVSLDGYAAQHNRIRGVPKAFERAYETITGLIRIGVQDLRIGFTATSTNIQELIPIYELSKSLGIEFSATVAQNSKIYYSISDNAEIDSALVDQHFMELARRRMTSKSPKDWLRSYFDYGVTHFSKTGCRISSCDAASGFFYLDPEGWVYPCLTIPRAIGNLRNQSFYDLWNSNHAQEIRGEARRCQKCWMACTSRTVLKKHPLRPISWILKNQARVIARRIQTQFILFFGKSSL